MLGCVGLPPLWEPPARVIFNLSVVRDLIITNDENGVRLFVEVSRRADRRHYGVRAGAV